MTNSTYPERLSVYIHGLPMETKNELLLKVALAVFDESAPAPTVKFATIAKLEQLLAEFRPELHAPFDKEALTTSLGEYLVEWWSESLSRPLTGRDLDHLLENLPHYGVREALKNAALAEADDEASDGAS